MEHSTTHPAGPTERAEASLARRIALGPRLGTAEDSQARVAAWLRDIADEPAGASLTRLLAEHPQLNRLIAGFAESAPYLWGLVRVEPTRLVALLESDPDMR